MHDVRRKERRKEAWNLSAAAVKKSSFPLCIDALRGALRYEGRKEEIAAKVFREQREF